ncbi:DNA primase large subunit, putative [Pediculus humanus corporis]|uniref:DNA primase large subunit n=1 Tax=Pediculus humanus subsp. corporis TaxID=121224 RepID=E0VYY2_PEDHC|nr:DNA primase large subunit, putative [Pediculus humanus corporis]EEB18588.1 DNA primase large subunit, putative [Pediculus humanus corporis]
MEFSTIGGTKKVTSKNFLLEKYPLDLTMYLEPPDERVPVDEIREMAVERVKLFRAFEVASVKLGNGFNFKELAIDEMNKQGLKYFMPLVKGYSDPEARRRDYLSHYMLRICYCRTEELRKWFVSREMEFFRLKFFNIENKEDITLFMKKNGLNYTSISDEEKQSLSTQLINSSIRHINLDAVNIYKVHFSQVFDLIKKRKVFLKLGNAYIPQTDLHSVISSVFKKNLIEELEDICKNLSIYESDQRVSAIVRGLHNCYTGKDYCKNTEKTEIAIENLDALSMKSYPLCMKAMHDTFKTTHHLRHSARLQYGLFLKGIGVSLTDSLKFWKMGFTQKPDINNEVFEKRYAYSIRHNYGSEGKRANYTPHNCLKIINTPVGPGENHGCPFKHYDSDSLKKMLLKSGISTSDILNITDYATKGHYQLACTRYFEVTHNITNANGINHPNQYFEDSQNLLNGTKPKEMKKQETSNQNYKFEPDWDDNIDLTNISDIINNANDTKNDN